MTKITLPFALIIALAACQDDNAPAPSTPITPTPELEADAEAVGRQAVELTACLVRWVAEAQPSRDQLGAWMTGRAEAPAVLQVSPENWQLYERRWSDVQTRLSSAFRKHGIDPTTIEPPSGIPANDAEAADQLYEISRRLASVPREDWPVCTLDGTSPLSTSRHDDDRVRCNWFTLGLCAIATGVGGALSGVGWGAVFAAGGAACVCSCCSGGEINRWCQKDRYGV